MNNIYSLYRCPVCSEHLEQTGRTFRCLNNHTFDIAKEGYVNLLPVNKKRSKEPGDSKEMLLARRQFLTSGYYQCLVNAISQILDEYLNADSAEVLDLGCGEGYYSRQLSESLCDSFAKLRFWGADISKFAVQMAAKQFKSGHYSVASSASLPYRGASFDFIFNIFAPYSLEEIERTLKPGGYFLQVGPGSEHLCELAQLVYDSVRPHQGNPVNKEQNSAVQQVADFRIADRQKIAGSEIAKLLMMTPYYWSISEQKKQKLSSLSSLEVSLDFELQLFKKSNLQGES